MANPTESALNRRPLALSDLARLRGVSDPQLSPDGRRVAFVVETIDPATNETRSCIWLAEEGAEPRPLTSGETSDSQPRWSPDGRALAFGSTRRSIPRGGRSPSAEDLDAGKPQVWVLPMNGGEARPVTNHPEGAREPVWSPDGQRLAFLAHGVDRRGDALPGSRAGAPPTDDRARLVWVRQHRHKLDGQGFLGPLRTHVWIVPAAGGPAEQITDGPFEDSDPAWSPDGSAIAFVSDRSPDHDRRFGGGAIHLVDVGTGVVRRLTPEDGRAARPAWSPDGRWLAYVGAEEPDDSSPSNLHLWVQPVDGGAACCLTADLDRSVGQRPGGYLTPSAPAWTADGALLYLLGDGPSTHLVRVEAPGLEGAPGPGARTALTTGRQVVLSFSVDRSTWRAALLVTDPTTPPEVWLWDAAEGVRPLTMLNRDLLAEVCLAAPEDWRIVRPDGTSVEGWLLRPPASMSGRLPLILSVHGGPHNYFGDTFSFDHQLYAALGYVVLYGNPRGSGGYGEAFARAVCADWGGEDFQDLLALVDAVVERGDPPLDPARLGITGSSYGGFLTCWAITQTDRFAAAVSGACISNLVSFFGTSDIGASWGVREFGGTPWERLDWYLARSPLTHAPRVRTPLLLYHGEADLRCPIEQSEQMFTALHYLGQTVALLRIPGESHAALGGTPLHRIEARRAILEWFARYLLPAH